MSREATVYHTNAEVLMSYNSLIYIKLSVHNTSDDFIIVADNKCNF